MKLTSVTHTALPKNNRHDRVLATFGCFICPENSLLFGSGTAVQLEMTLLPVKGLVKG